MKSACLHTLGTLALLSDPLILCLGDTGATRPRANTVASDAISLFNLNPFRLAASVKGHITHFNEHVVGKVCHEQERLINTTCWHCTWKTFEAYRAKWQAESVKKCKELTAHFNSTTKIKLGKCEAKMGLAAFVNLKCEKETEDCFIKDILIERKKWHRKCVKHWIKKIDCTHKTIPNPKLAWDIGIYFKHTFSFGASFSLKLDERIKFVNNHVQKWTSGIQNSTASIIESSKEIRFVVEASCRAQWAAAGHLGAKLEAWGDKQVVDTCKGLQARFAAEHSGSHETSSKKRTWKVGIAAEVYANCTDRAAEKHWELILKKETEFVAKCTAKVMADLGGGFDMSFITSGCQSFEKNCHLDVEASLKATATVEFKLVANQSYEEFMAKVKTHTERLFADAPVGLPSVARGGGPALVLAAAAVAVAAGLVAVQRSRRAAAAEEAASWLME